MPVRDVVDLVAADKCAHPQDLLRVTKESLSRILELRITAFLLLEHFGGVLKQDGEHLALES